MNYQAAVFVLPFRLFKPINPQEKDELSSSSFFIAVPIIQTNQ
jgi:hypothetical protein